MEGADRLGLSQLYQLRGRVGRSDRQAYAYFLYSGTMDFSFVAQGPAGDSTRDLTRKHKTVTEGALARLQALQEFSNLGSGYSLAFRDLQIRGAGELLGAKQSGTMVTVGYELYTQLIQDAVAQLKNSVDGQSSPGLSSTEAVNLEPLPIVDLPVVAMLPDTYVQDQAQRLYYYQRLMSVRDSLSLAAVQAEIEDRYGRPPRPVQNVFQVLEIRIRAKHFSIEKIDGREGRLHVCFRAGVSHGARVFTLMNRANSKAHVGAGGYYWPYEGYAIRATEEFLSALESAIDQVAIARAALS
jgi:transcription-repair coupling factor (superfamily II helicase)